MRKPTNTSYKKCLINYKVGTENTSILYCSNSIGNFSKLSRNIKIRFKKNFSPLPERTFDTTSDFRLQTSAMGPKAYYLLIMGPI